MQKFIIIETAKYVVEADDIEAAKEKFSSGMTDINLLFSEVELLERRIMGEQEVLGDF